MVGRSHREYHRQSMPVAPASIRLIAFDIDGTLTDADTWWGGEDRGWLQRYSVRDEASET